MKTETLVKLLDAGYTKEEIAQMEAPADPAPADPAPADPAPADPAPADPKSEDKTIADIMAIIGRMQKTLDSLQKSNAKNADTGMPPERTTADKVIRDFFAERKKAQDT